MSIWELFLLLLSKPFRAQSWSPHRGGPRDVEESRQAACGRPAPSTLCAGAKAVGSATDTLPGWDGHHPPDRWPGGGARSHSPRTAELGLQPTSAGAHTFPYSGPGRSQNTKMVYTVDLKPHERRGPVGCPGVSGTEATLATNSLLHLDDAADFTFTKRGSSSRLQVRE